MPFSTLGIDIQTGQVVQLARSARLQGVYILGLQGTGKSGLLEHLIMQDIEQGIGLCLFDPHGSITNRVLTHLPLDRMTDVILLEARTPVKRMGTRWPHNLTPRCHRKTKYRHSKNDPRRTWHRRLPMN